MNRSEIFEKIAHQLESTKQELELEIASLRDSFENDTKSSAGDKYETSREMTQQEIAKLELSLNQKTEQLNLLEHYKQVESDSKIQLGNIIETNRGIFLLGIPFGKLELEDSSIFGLGKTAPLSLVLIRFSKGERCELNGMDYHIQNLY